MKKFLMSILGVLVFSGCASSGYGTAGHNGKMYWFPKKCSKYEYYYNDADALHCLDNGERTGQIIYPADSTQVQNYYAGQQASAARAQANAAQQRADDAYWSDMNRNMQLMQINNNLMRIK